MIRSFLLTSVILLSFLLVSCFKEDEKVTPHQPGNTIVDTIALTSLYKYQVYYKLSGASAVLTNTRKQWDLALQSTPEGLLIRLNTSCFMYAATLLQQDFGAFADTAAAVWKFDNSNGDADSTALGNCFTISGNDTIGSNVLYVINRGIDEQGNDRGFRQLKIDSLSNGIYYFRTAHFDGSNQLSFAIPKTSATNYVLADLDHGLAAAQEPPVNNWDLLFSQYTTLLYTDLGEPYPYLVTGVLLNPNLVEVARDTVQPFEQITFESVQDLIFTTRQDVIGYDWKFYDFDTGSYTVRNNQVYIIRDVEGFWYKLRFLGFYNEKGEKGYPSIEFQRL